MSSGRGEVARELRGSEAERLVRSIEGGEGWRRGFDGEVELVGARAGGGGVLGILGRERAKGRGELVEGVLVVSLRARDWALGFCLGRATATARWRPAAASGWRGKGKRGPARGVEAVERSSATRGCQRKQEVAGEAAQSGRRRCAGEQGSRAGKQAGGRRKGTSLQIPKFQGPYYKLAITFNLGLK